MLDKPIVMIHEFREEFLSLPLDQFILTFDDGLFSQYHFWPKLQKISTQKIFFISSGIICPEHIDQSTKFVDCITAHQNAKNNLLFDYIKLSQIKELIRDPYTIIGGHSHSHSLLHDRLPKVTQLQHLISDTSNMVSWFIDNLNYTPTHFCYPYNNDYRGLYNVALKKYNILHCYGKERISIESLIKSIS